MEPQPALNLVPTIQQAITSLLTTHEPEFLRFGYRACSWRSRRSCCRGKASG